MYIAAPSRVVGSAMLNQAGEVRYSADPENEIGAGQATARTGRHRSEPATAGRLKRLGVYSRCSECQSGGYRIWNTSKATRENSNIDAPVDVAMTVA